MRGTKFMSNICRMQWRDINFEYGWTIYNRVRTFLTSQLALWQKKVDT